MLELNRLYLMDCMEGMAQFPDGFFDLAIVDPPYGVGSVAYMPHTRQKAAGGYIDKYEVIIATLDMNQRRNIKTNIEHSNNTHTTITKFGDMNVAPGADYFKELFRVSKNQIIFGGNYYLLPPTRGFVIWRKPTVSENFSMAMCEYIWTSFNRNAKVVEFNPMQKPGMRFHPTQKPVDLYKWLIDKYAKLGDKILDTHAGSASSLAACQELGFEYIGFEIEPDYHALAAARLAEAKANTGGKDDTRSEVLGQQGSLLCPNQQPHRRDSAEAEKRELAGIVRADGGGGVPCRDGA